MRRSPKKGCEADGDADSENIVFLKVWELCSVKRPARAHSSRKGSAPQHGNGTFQAKYRKAWFVAKSADHHATSLRGPQAEWAETHSGVMLAPCFGV
jgi:hypothetical protein